MNDLSFLKANAIGSLVAVTTLIMMALLPWPFEFTFPGEGVLIGRVELTSATFEQYVASLQRHLVVDTIFIIGWIVGWVGLRILIRIRHKL